MIRWAFIFEAPEMDPVVGRMVIEATGGRMPVGAVGYAGGASVTRLAEIFAPSP